MPVKVQGWVAVGWDGNVEVNPADLYCLAEGYKNINQLVDPVEDYMSLAWVYLDCFWYNIGFSE